MFLFLFFGLGPRPSCDLSLPSQISDPVRVCKSNHKLGDDYHLIHGFYDDDDDDNEDDYDYDYYEDDDLFLFNW